MNSYLNTKWMVLGLAVSLIAGLMTGVMASKRAADTSYKNTARLIGEIVSKKPELEEFMMMALKSDDADDFKTGSGILRRYGYSANIFFEKNNLMLITDSLLMWGIAFFLFAGIVYGLKKKKRARITGLTKYLNSINQGLGSIQPRTQEDEFSLLEDELYKTVMELRETRETAVKERKSLANNLADIAHQIKTPITSMSLMTELLSESRKGREDALYVEKMQKQLNRLDHLVSALLTLSKLDAGTLEFEQRPVDVFVMLAWAAEPMEEVMEQKGQTLTIQSEPPTVYMGDFNWSAEAVFNLIKNCSEHISVGGAIMLSYEQNPIFTKIVVEDNGKGFIKEDIPYLFERFYRGKNARKDSVGIGLALAKSIIEKQNGVIRAENRPEGGARFVIKFYAS